MGKLIVIQLGSGTLQQGFPLVTAQLWEQPNALPEQFTGALPAAPQLQVLSQNWQALYRALCAMPTGVALRQHSDAPWFLERATRSLRSPLELEDDPDDELDIEPGGIQHVSSYDFDDLCKTFSQEFNHWLSGPDFRPIERPLRSRLSLQDDIRIILTTPSDDIRRLPWQRWDLIEDFPGAELALSLPQYRRQTSRSASRSTPRILAILGSDQGIDLAAEHQQLKQLQLADVTFLIQPTRQQFNQVLWDKAGWDLLFFAGHSSSETSQSGRLYLSDDVSLTIAELSEALIAALNTGLKLAIFNSCDGLGLAHQLAHLNIPQVIVMREPVPNRVAQQFFQSFLEAYVQQSLPLYAAVKQSRRQLQGMEDDFPGASWLPLLYQNPAEVPPDWSELTAVASTAEPDGFSVTPSLSRQAYRDRQILLNKLRNAWIKGVLHKSLPHHIGITVGLVEQPTMLKTPANTAIEQATAGYPLPPGTQIADYFDQLGTGRSLLLLGAPGAGKTIALLELAQTLIDRAEGFGPGFKDQYPVPVVLNLSTWSTSSSRPMSILQWLQQALYSYYQVPQQQSEQLVQAADLILLLDGLDEIPAHCRADCIQALNQFHQDYPTVELVVCSRPDAYQSTGEYLNVQAALELQPLASAQVQDYCRALGPAGKPLRQLLEGDRQLSHLATSPLMLNIITLAAQDMIDAEDNASGRPTLLPMASPDSSQPDLPRNEPQNDSLDARRHHLFNAYINRMLTRRQSSTVDNPAAIISGLRYLAQQLQGSGQSVFQIESIQPSWLDSQAGYLYYSLIVGVVLATLLSFAPALAGLWLSGVGAALAVVVSWGIIGGSISGLIGGWPGGITGGLMGGIVNALWLWLLVPQFFIGMIATPLLAIFMGFIFGAYQERIEPIESIRWSWRKAGKRLLLGLGVGMLVSVPIWLINSVEWRVIIPAVGIFFMLLGGFTKRSHLDAQKTTRPNEGMWRTGQNALTLGLVSTLIYGVASCIIFGLNTGGDWTSFVKSVPFGAIAGLIIGTATALVGAEGSGIVCVQHFVLRILLWQQNRIPWNYARFLDQCADRILLKKVGGSYIFSHRLLQEHFANWRPSR